jgi:pimeloyl-ACP methyl ester carboxylesterase
MAETEVSIAVPGAQIQADFMPLSHAAGLVIFAHGSGSSRHSSRNRHVAHLLQARGCATLLLDLLTYAEAEVDEVTREFRFNIPLLAERVVAAIDWAQKNVAAKNSAACVGVFGASTGAAAALIAAAERSAAVKAVVSRGGRPDLAGFALSKVRAPTLLIVGADDDACIPLNESAFAALTCQKRLELVAGATHLFEEPGTLDIAAGLAADWFVHYLR